MKKDLIFAPFLALVGASLFLLKFTGMTAHIVISVVGVLLLVAYAVLTKQEWKIPALEIAMRAFYAVALISGIVIKIVHGIAFLGITHKIFAVLFFASFIALLASKLVLNKKN